MSFNELGSNALYNEFKNDQNNKMKKPPKSKLEESYLKEAPQPIEGGAFIKHVLKKGGKGGTELLIADLDEASLGIRLNSLQKELTEYKKRCSRYKTENAWYREEIESSQRDTLEYVAYLESKKEEKLNVINNLIATNQNDIVKHNAMKEEIENENNKKLEGRIVTDQAMRDTIAHLEFQLKLKEDEFLQLADTIKKREKHKEKVAKLKDEIREAEENHHLKILELDKKLLEERMKAQLEAEAKIKQMEAAAEEKASKYLQDHSTQLQQENLKLEKELELLTLQSQRMILRKEQLERENCALEMEKKTRLDLIKLRIEQIKNAEDVQFNMRKKKKELLVKKRKNFMDKILNSKIKSGENEEEAEKEAIIEARWDDLDSENGFE